jgi:hypothetical protein
MKTESGTAGQSEYDWNMIGIAKQRRIWHRKGP